VAAMEGSSVSSLPAPVPGTGADRA
jgi:hypothetical protein